MNDSDGKGPLSPPIVTNTKFLYPVATNSITKKNTYEKRSKEKKFIVQTTKIVV